MKHTYKIICLPILLKLIVITAQAQSSGEICDNGIDDDGNGLIDCADPAASCYLFQDCSQETDCGNGIDDDGDGFIDYYDGDCLDDPDNPNDYITVKPDCEAEPVGNSFDIAAAWDSDIQTSAALGMPSVADLDQDGFPEVITMNSETGELYILDGRTGGTLDQVEVKDGQVFAYPAVGDVDGDGFGEIFTIDLKGVIRVYNHDLTLKWTQTSSFTGFGRPLGLADFNQDGKAELYSVNEIWDAETGTLLIKGSHGNTPYPSANDWQEDLNPVPVAIDIIPTSAGLELVVGHIIYTVNITNVGGTAGNSLTEAMNMDDAASKPAGYNGYYPADADYGNQTFSQTAVVDYNQDGSLDVLIGGANGGIDGPTTVFFWDIANDEIKTYTVLRPGNTIPGNIKGTFEDKNGNACDDGDLCYWERGLGNINIADIDNDGQLEATFMSGSSLYALETDLTEKWANHTHFWESSSGVTGTTVFDFDGDGSSEIVYRDEIDLYIINGGDGIPLNSQISGTFCSSQTQGDYPIVADVDGDGETEIIISCGQAQNIHGESPATSGTRTNGFIRAYKAAGGNYWVPSRKLWNQTNYFNVNINDNLSIPRVQQSHHLNFAQICNDPSAPASFSLNKFLNQSPRISYCGQLTFPSPKLDFADDGVIITPPVCPDNQFDVRLIFANHGSQDIIKPVPVSFYAANPTNSYSNTDASPYLETVDIDIPGGIKVGDTVDVTIPVTGLRGMFSLFVSLNDIGQKDSDGLPISNADFYPLTKLNGTIRECDDTPTIISKAVNPLPFEVKAVKIRDNRNCPGEVATNNNGEIQVLAPDDTPFPASSYAFTWTNIATGDVISNDAIVSGLDAGTYQVVVENTDYGCFGNADTVTVLRFEDWPDTQVITLEELQPVSSCAPGTADGIARVLINGLPVDETEYDVEWADEQQDDKVLAIGDTATNLKPILYKVTVTNKLTGCSDSETIDMTLPLPDMGEPTVTENTNCKDPNGSISAKLNSGSKSDYEYILVQHSPVQDTITNHNNGSFTGLAEGFYELIAYDKTTECGLYSDGIMVEIVTSKAIIDIPISVAKEQTSCIAPYNGQLTATVNAPNKYTWVWYRGTVTSGPTAEIVANNYFTPDTLSTNITDVYTVVATETSSGCSFTGQITLTENIILPNADATGFTVKHQTTCSPDGSIQAAVANAETGASYVYTLLQGSTELASNGTGLFENLAAGPYVVMIKNTVSGCVSMPSDRIDIDDNIPAFSTYTITDVPVTNCNASAPNGSLTLNFSGGNGDYDFEWFVGVDTSTPVSPQPSVPNSLTNISAGDYKVIVTSDLTGCDTLISLVLDDNSEEYQDQITATVTRDQEFCFPSTFSGEIQASLLQSTSGGVPDVNDYTFYWYQGKKNDLRNSTATLISGENSVTISGLNVGWYSVRAVKNDGSACHALDTAEVYINDARDFPITNINVTIVDQSSCNSNDPNGSLIGDVGGNTADYNFTWYQLIGGVKTPVTTNNPGAIVSGNSVLDIGVGTYVLVAKNIATGCTGETQVYLKDNIIKGDEIRLNLSSEEATICTPPNGVAEVVSIDLSEDDGATFTISDDLNNYTYQWYYDEDTTSIIDPIVNPTATTARLENVEPGMYTVVANNINSECASVYYSVEVTGEIQNLLNFDLLETTQTDCINPDGGLEVIDITGGTGPFLYQWYKGGDDTYPLTSETSPILSNIRADKYMIRITDQSSGCYKDSVYVLPPDTGITPVPPATLSIVDHVTTCDPTNYNGRLVAEVDAGVLALPNFSSHAPSDFFYYWFKGENPQYIDTNATPIDDISNFAVLNNDPPVIGDNKAEITDLEPGFYTVIVIDAKDYIASGGTADLGCRSDARTFEVKAIAQSPEVAFTTLNDSLCVGDSGSAKLTIGKRDTDNTVFSGFIITDATQNGASFFPLPGTVNVTPNNDVINRQTDILLENLNAASYTFTLFDNTTKCDTTIALDISDISVAPVLAFDNLQLVNHKTSCNPTNGSAEVIVSASGAGITDLSDFTFYWHDALPTVATDITTNAIQTGATATGLDTGIYYVYAVNNVTGCVSSDQSIEIKDRVPSTVIQIVSSSPDRNCDPAIGTGSISIQIHDEDFDGNVVYPTGGYTISWVDANGVDFTAQATTDGGAQPATSILPNLLAGVYSISVENNDTQCGAVIARDTIKYEPYIPAFTASSAQVTNSTTCDGNGEITISEIRENSVVISSSDAAFADYEFEWRYSDDMTVLQDGGGSDITSNTVTDLLPGTYYVYIINTTTGNCPSNRLQVVIEDKSKLPLIYQKDKVDFISCTGINEGAIEVLGGEFVSTNKPPLGYKYEWTLADGSAMPTFAVYNADSSRVSNLQNGRYQVLMTNLSTGCQQIATYTIGLKQVTPILLMTKLADQAYCFGDGSAEVSEVRMLGSTLNVNDFRFTWYENDLSTTVSAPQYGLSLDSLRADSLIAGTYFVVAENIYTGCTSLPVQVQIDDITEPLIVLLDDISEPIIACDPSNFPEGEIEIEVRNSTTVITSWYVGSTINDPADSIAGFNNTLEINGLVPGPYTVWVQDTLTGCSTTRTYTIEGVEVPIVVSTSSSDFRSCIQPDGMIAANINGGSGDYIISWYSGSGTNLQPLTFANNNTFIEGLTNGTYTVVVQDKIEPYCQESRAEIVVEDSRGQEIMVNVNNDFQMTNCDESLPNGQLSVEVNGELSRYNFFWYNGTNTNSKPIASGPVIANLLPGEYTVLARDKVTGCISRAFTGEVIATPDTTIIAAPIVSTTPVTRCDTPNGTATAVLDSAFIEPNVDYEYTWLNSEGEVVFSSSRTNTAHFLAQGDYTVIATNTLSGCSSESAEFTIGEDIYIPEFEIISTPSTCLEPNGSIRLEFVESIKIVDIEWLTPDGFATGFYLVNQPAGEYEVTITDDKGCKHTKTAEIKSTIHAYNGISANGDGKNDKFIISCIEQYDENIVRIYNRAGAIVYENYNYDNDKVYFEGTGNRGLYIGGDKLPEGTYYYIIDKRNGEKPVSGYLELLR